MTTELRPMPPSGFSLPREEAEAPVHLSSSYRTTVITTIEQFEALRGNWTAFMSQAQANNLCLSHGWLLTWLKHFPPDQLLVVIVQDALGNWIAAAPFKISRGKNGVFHRLLKQVQFIGTHPSVYDWMKIVIRPGVDESMAIQAIAQVLRQTDWDVLDLLYNLERSQLEILCQALDVTNPDALIQETTPIPYVALPPTEEAYAGIRRKKTRLEVNRHCNRFEKEFGEPPSLNFYASGEASNAILTRFFAGHIKYWSEKGSKSDFQRFPALYGFYKAMLDYSENQAQESGPKLLFSVLKVNDHQLSYHLGFWQGNAYLSHITHYNQGFRTYSPGTIHMDKLIFDTISRGGAEFEFGRGDEPYKQLWTKTKKTLWNLRIFRNPVAQGVWQLDIQLKKMTGKSFE